MTVTKVSCQKLKRIGFTKNSKIQYFLSNKTEIEKCDKAIYNLA